MIAIINGPNLNLLGKRQPEIYGCRSLRDIAEELKFEFPQTEFMFFQSNHEGEIIDLIHKLGWPEKDGSSNICDGIVLNPGAFAHYSIAIADAIRSIPVPVVEVHLSNIAAREEYRRRSVTAEACIGSVSGLGTDVYILAAMGLLRRIRKSL